MQRVKASIEDTVTLGVYLASQMPADQIPAWLKAKNYTVRNKNFKAGSVAFTAVGYQKGHSQARAELLAELESITTLKALKAFKETLKV